MEREQDIAINKEPWLAVFLSYIIPGIGHMYFGPVPGKNIFGRVTKIYWPFNRSGVVE
jgi:hypothetical protein